MARFNKKYIIGEAKFLTDFGGHQNAQFNDAINTIETPNIKAIKVAILDGVLYIESNNKMRKLLDTTYRNYHNYERVSATRIFIPNLNKRNAKLIDTSRKCNRSTFFVK